MCHDTRIRVRARSTRTKIPVRNQMEQKMSGDLLHLRQALYYSSSSAFCRVNIGGKCSQAGIERDRSGLVENTVPFGIRKFRYFKQVFLVEWNAPVYSRSLVAIIGNLSNKRRRSDDGNRKRDISFETSLTLP